jgi:hypothetical protein
MPTATQQLNPEKIIQVAFGFWPSKVLLTAVELGLFTVLSGKEMTAEELAKKLSIRAPHLYDFFDCLVALGFLNRERNGKDGRYSNTEETDFFLDKNKPSYIGGIMEMGSKRLFPNWVGLTEGLRTGQAQSEAKEKKEAFFDAIYSDPAKLEQFVMAMSGISKGNFAALADKFDFSKYKTLCDIGGAAGLLSITVAKRHPHIQCTTTDLPKVLEIAKKEIAKEKLSDRVKTATVDFFKDKFPKADIITMGNILHDWNLKNKKMLIGKAFEALPKGGAFIIIENIIDDARRENAFGLMMSLNMLIELGDGFDCTFADFKGWCQEAGFTMFEKIHLNGPCSAGVAWK